MLHKFKNLREKGTSLVICLTVIFVMVGFSGVALQLVVNNNKKVVDSYIYQKAFYLAESGLNASVAEINGKIDVDSDGLGILPETSMANGSWEVGNAQQTGNAWTITATGTYSGKSVSVTGIFRRTVTVIPGVSFGLTAGRDGIVSQSSAIIDSYDSEVADYTPVSHSAPYDTYDHDQRNGSVRSEGTISVTSSTVIHGDALSNAGVTLDSSAKITGDAYGDPIAENGSAELIGAELPPLTDPVVLPPVTLPSISGPDTNLSTTGTVTITSGDYRYTGFSLDSAGAVTIIGPARILVDGDFSLNSSSQLKIDVSDGPVTFFVTGRTTFTSSSKVVHLNTPIGYPQAKNFRIESTNTTNGPDEDEAEAAAIAFNSSHDFVGTVYVPEGKFYSGSSVQLTGAFAGLKVQLNSSTLVHYDESLANLTGDTEVLGDLSIAQFDFKAFIPEN